MRTCCVLGGVVQLGEARHRGSVAATQDGLRVSHVAHRQPSPAHHRHHGRGAVAQLPGRRLGQKLPLQLQQRRAQSRLFGGALQALAQHSPQLPRAKVGCRGAPVSVEQPHGVKGGSVTPTQRSHVEQHGVRVLLLAPQPLRRGRPRARPVRRTPNATGCLVCPVFHELSVRRRAPRLFRSHSSYATRKPSDRPLSETWSCVLMSKC
jgi:hypothetical protein